MRQSPQQKAPLCPSQFLYHRLIPHRARQFGAGHDQRPRRQTQQWRIGTKADKRWQNTSLRRILQVGNLISLQNLPNTSRTLCSSDIIAERLKMLSLPHIAPLTAFVENLRSTGPKDVPYFDPLDGGIKAPFLFIFEKPGPMASSSGFISRDNNDKTAENTFQFMQSANIDRKKTCLWNLIPAWNGSRKVTTAELKRGFDSLQKLLPLLPKLRAVMLVGKNAQKSANLFKKTNLRTLSSYHPSPITYATARDKWESIPREWEKLKSFPA